MSKTKSVCIMTSVHRFDDVRIYHKEAKAFKKAGYDVTILCSNLKSPEQTEWTDEFGIHFIKVNIPSGRTKRILSATSCFYKAAKSLQCDYYHFHDPELIKAGLKLQKFAKVIYDIHEDVPRQILTKPYLKPFIAKVASQLFEKHEVKAAKKLYGIVAAEPVIYDRMAPLNPNTIMVCNYPKLEEFELTDNDNNDRKNEICYIGGITKIRGIFEMLDAIQGTDIKLILAGEFETQELKQEVQNHPGYKNVDYRGFIGREEVKEVLSRVKAGLVTLHPIPKYLTALPVKMFEYMIAEVPVISSDFPYWKAIVDDAQCGICVDPMNSGDIKDAILYLFNHQKEASQMGESGRKKVLEKYNWEIEQQKLLAFYNNRKEN
ncbi:glycosyltransferase family 4 protein [Paludicola sp. MB14-C6]|uniref:glycosyltransferase family 4 protein n=1 Tax=Paludihabitans sp. MB14-C6 TaxID=3070656 RepID=UPI0027DADAD4|nr:glycosyltransferase family 4 protein [Paludicola sp. MB14-C6]WMJ22589.1 glycosyltransferase family 4 protein [Paludicola sp. MB14-C6]